MGEDSKKLVEVTYHYSDGTSKTKKAWETDMEARDRLCNPFDEGDEEYEEILNWIVPKLNKMGGRLDIAFKALIIHGMDGVEAENEINKLIEGEMF